MLLNHPNLGREAAPRSRDAVAPPENPEQELERLRNREHQMLDLLGSSSPDRLIHDLRNVLNEVQLLRMLADDKA